MNWMNFFKKNINNKRKENENNMGWKKNYISAQNRKYNSRNMKIISILHFCRQKWKKANNYFKIIYLNWNNLHRSFLKFQYFRRILMEWLQNSSNWNSILVWKYLFKKVNEKEIEEIEKMTSWRWWYKNIYY